LKLDQDPKTESSSTSPSARRLAGHLSPKVEVPWSRLQNARGVDTPHADGLFLDAMGAAAGEPTTPFPSYAWSVAASPVPRGVPLLHGAT